MDFTDDACLNMFTNGQVARMRELFASDGARHALLSSQKAAGSSDADIAATPVAVRLSVYPNPAANELRVSFDKGEELSGRQLVIYNHLGQVARRVVATRSEMTISLSGLPAGVYFLSCDGYSQKFLKVN